MSGAMPLPPSPLYAFLAYAATALPLPFSASSVFQNEYNNVYEVFT